MPTRTSSAQWTGGLKAGKGQMKVGSGAFEGPYSFGSRFENEKGSNPEELIAAAHAGCFSMAFSMLLEQAGHVPEMVDTTANIHLDQQQDGGFKITRIELQTQAQVPGIKQSDFEKYAQQAKQDCPVSQLLTGADISLTAQLK